MSLIKYLANLGYGTRREVTTLCELRRVTDADGSPVRPTDPWDHDTLRVDGELLDPPPSSVLMLHKPVGYVCSTTDATNPVVYELLPPRFRSRSPLMSPVGRLDRDTSGLLLITDDGAFNHRLTSPRSHVPKVYEATVAEPLRGTEAALFGSGALQLDGETAPLKPAMLEVVSAHCARVTLTEGKYHQVRRMFAAVGHHVVQLERVAVGALSLGELPSGSWRVLTAPERALLWS